MDGLNNQLNSLLDNELGLKPKASTMGAMRQKKVQKPEQQLPQLQNQEAHNMNINIVLSRIHKSISINTLVAAPVIHCQYQ